MTTFGLNLNTDTDILDSGIALHSLNMPFGISQFSLFTSKHSHTLGSVDFQVFIILCHVLTLVDSTYVKSLCYSTRLSYNSSVGRVNWTCLSALQQCAYMRTKEEMDCSSFLLSQEAQITNQSHKSNHSRDLRVLSCGCLSLCEQKFQSPQFNNYAYYIQGLAISAKLIMVCKV